jgi:hypothetical protein
MSLCQHDQVLAIMRVWTAATSLEAWVGRERILREIGQFFRSAAAPRRLRRCRSRLRRRFRSRCRLRRGTGPSLEESAAEAGDAHWVTLRASAVTARRGRRAGRGRCRAPRDSGRKPARSNRLGLGSRLVVCTSATRVRRSGRRPTATARRRSASTCRSRCRAGRATAPEPLRSAVATTRAGGLTITTACQRTLLSTSAGCQWSDPLMLAGRPRAAAAVRARQPRPNRLSRPARPSSELTRAARRLFPPTYVVRAEASEGEADATVPRLDLRDGALPM